MAVMFLVSTMKLLLTLWLLLGCNCDVIVEESGYASYTRTQSTEKFNQFQIEFKTTQPTGLLLHAKGAKDFVTLELIKGKLRYAANFGDTFDSYKEWSSGYHELFMHQNLANGEWHTIVLMHKEASRTVDITIDNHRETKSTISRTIPPRSAEFTIEYVHTGGMKGIEMLSEKESLSQRGIKGCFKNTTLNSKSVIEGKDVTLSNAKVAECMSYVHFPIDFPAKDSYASYNYTGSGLHMKFGLKTNIPNQSLLSYISNKLSVMLTMNLDASGKIIIKVGGKKISSFSQSLHDSFWHEIELSVSAKSPYAVELTVDKQKSSMNLDQKLIDGEKVLIGRGYIGCVKNLMINNTKIVSDHLDMYAANYLQMIEFGRCNLKEFCVPNPCLHGGKCNQTANSFSCDCTNTGYTGSACSKSLYSKSCDELKTKEKGRTTDGKKLLDVDGIGPLPGVEVECNYLTSGTVTKVPNKLAKEVIVENRFGAKSIKIPYTADKRSVKSIVDRSASCKQDVSYSCVKSYLFQSPTGPAKVRWLGPDYYFHYYWGGSNGKEHYCRCGIGNNCTDPAKYCNCDAHSAVMTKDTGYLVNKKHLPMQKIEFLDVNSNTGSQGRFSLGPLICTGDLSKDRAVSFRDALAFLSLPPTSVTDFNNAIDALTLSFDFKTALASGVMVYAVGKTSPDFMKIHLRSKTIARAEINLGSKMSYVDVDIESTGRNFDDNQAHSVLFEFNRKEISFSVDHVSGAELIDPNAMTHLNLDGQPMFLGGGYGIIQGFVGCIQSFFINGLLIDTALKAKDLESTGVYAGCGIGCNRPQISPCNFGKCLEQYKTFSCDCSLSSFDGKYCHKESFPLHFTSKSGLMFVFEKPVQVYEGHIVTSFKTDNADGFIFSLVGDNHNCHLSLVMQGGRLKLMYNFDKLSSTFKTLDVESASGKTMFNTGKLYSLRITHNGKRVSVQLLDGKSKAQKKDIASGNSLLSAVKISIASSKPNAMLPQLPGMQSFNGCMSSFKYEYTPNLASKSVSTDVFALFREGNKAVTGKGVPGKCGKSLPTPPPLPDLLNRPTDSPDKGLPVPGPSSVVSDDMSPIIIAVACVLAVLLIVIIIMFCRHINRSLGAYKTNEDRRPLAAEQETSFNPPPDSKDGKSSDSAGDEKPGKKQEWYV